MGGEDRDALELGAPLSLSDAGGSHRLIIQEEQQMGTDLGLLRGENRLVHGPGDTGFWGTRQP